MFVPCFAGFIGLLAKALTISCRRKLISRHRNGNVPFTVACSLAPASPRQNPKSNHTIGKHCGDRTRSRMLYEICLFAFSKRIHEKWSQISHFDPHMQSFQEMHDVVPQVSKMFYGAVLPPSLMAFC